MKRIFFIASLLTLITAMAAVKTSAKLEWDYPAEDVPFVTFNLYRSGSITGPFTVLTNVATTNVVVSLAEGKSFYYVTATNEWGESDPSNTVFATVPRRGQNLRITAQ